VTTGPCAMGAREPGQDRKVAAFIGIVRVPQTVWSSPQSAALPRHRNDPDYIAGLTPDVIRSGCEAGRVPHQFGGIDLGGDGCEFVGRSGPVPVVDGADVDIGDHGGDLAEQQCVGELRLQGR